MKRWFWLTEGVALSVVAGWFKVQNVQNLPGVFEYAFFSGISYIFLVAGLMLMIIGLCEELLFGGEDGSPSTENRR